MILVPVSGTAVAASPPRTVLTDGVKLASIRQAVRSGHATKAQLDALKAVLDKDFASPIDGISFSDTTQIHDHAWATDEHGTGLLVDFQLHHLTSGR